MRDGQKPAWETVQSYKGGGSGPLAAAAAARVMRPVDKRVNKRGVRLIGSSSTGGGADSESPVPALRSATVDGRGGLGPAARGPLLT